MASLGYTVLNVDLGYLEISLLFQIKLCMFRRVPHTTFKFDIKFHKNLKLNFAMIKSKVSICYQIASNMLQTCYKPSIKLVDKV